jgi:pilus assembly protein FimV
MITMKRISAATLLAVASLAYSPESSALGLGDVTVESFLNQPLQMRIDLITRESDDLTSVTAKMASADDYQLIGASLESVPVPIRFALEDLEGDAHIVATSTLPVNEPVVRLIVEVNWASGRLLREYTIFLDPATVPEQAPLPRMDRRAEPAPAAAEVRPVTEPAPAAERSATMVPARQPQTGEYGPVRSGETLWAIASKWSDGSGLDMNQVMIAIQRENPQAFLNDNINLLKRGAILRMPAVEQVDDIPVAAAISEVAAQTDAFRNWRRADAASPATPLLAEERAPAPPGPTEEATTAAEDATPTKIPESAEPAADEVPPAEPEAADAEPEADAAPAVDEAQLTDQLELVPPSADSELDSVYGFEEADEDAADANASMAVSALREDLARTEEELVNQQQQNNYLQERIQELESQLAAQAQDGVADADLANMEDRLRAQREATPASEPWYSRVSYWLIGLLVVVAGFIGWLFSRRGGGEAAREVAAGQELRGIKDEAEEVLRVLDEPAKPAAAEPEPEPISDEAAEAAPEEAEESAPAMVARRGDDDAELLDEESSDPEIQLDLARAYISMGDKEAARVILEEVVANGSEKQQAEAEKMLELLAS